MFGSTVAAGLAGHLAALTGVLVRPAAGIPLVDLALALAAVLVAVLLLRAGRSTDRGLLVAAGAGTLLLGGANVLHGLALAGGASLASAALRLVAALVVLHAVVAELRLAWAARAQRDQSVRERWTHAEERASAAEFAARRRNHDLRNGLAGIAGATHILGASPRVDDPDLAALAQAVHDEVVRLQRAVAPRRPIDHLKSA